jgi:hypothetical protein
VIGEKSSVDRDEVLKLKDELEREVQLTCCRAINGKP